MSNVISHTVEVVRRELGLLRSHDAANFYQYMGFDVLEGRERQCDDVRTPLWLNFGYWKGVDTQDQACRQLADMLGDAAQIGSSDHVLDCGFGFGEQDVHWLATRKPGHITGVNITRSQLDFAQQRIHGLGLSDRITLKLASATQLPFADASFDCVVALESAFHFNTRDRFFAEAFRVLRPGGRLATVDCLPLPGDPIPPWAGVTLKRFAWPIANCYDRHVYAQKLENWGFLNVQKRSIRNYVFPGLRAYARARARGAARDARIHIPPTDFDRCRGALLSRVLIGIGDYVVMSAHKPAS